MMWGWSRRTGGHAQRGGGQQQAAMEIRAKRARSFMGSSHTDRRFLRMAAELGMVAFKLERLALKLKSYLCSPFCASKWRAVLNNEGEAAAD